MFIREIQIVRGNRILSQSEIYSFLTHKELKERFERWKKSERDAIKVWLNAAVQGKGSFSSVKNRVEDLLNARIQQVQYEREEISLPEMAWDEEVKSLDPERDFFCDDVLTIISRHKMS